MNENQAYHRATVRVPATTGNVGSGFDVIGMAIALWNRVAISCGQSAGVVVHGEGNDVIPTDDSNLTYRAARRVLQEAGLATIDFGLEVWQEVPISRGLGSSACAIVGGMAAANALLKEPLPIPHLLLLASEFEGHVDQLAPALIGGCCITLRDGDRILSAPVPVPSDLQCVVFIPEVSIPTEKAREVLGPQVSREDAVFNIARAALLVASFATGHPEYLGVATDDRLHQPARQAIFPAMKHLFFNARKAGARAVFLSGAGSSVIAFTTRGEGRAFTIGYEMADAADKAGLPGQFWVLDPCLTGVEILELDGNAQ
jgi:homoserine kinase